MTEFKVKGSYIKELKLKDEEMEIHKERSFLKESITRIRNDLDFLMDSYKRFESRAKYDIDTLNQAFHRNLDNYLAKLTSTVLQNMNLKLEHEAEKKLQNLLEFMTKKTALYNRTFK